MICGKPSHIRKWFGPCVLSYGHGGSCEHPPLEALHESDGRCSKCGNDREAWDRAIAEIARLTAELAAARAVPPDVEEAILTLVGVTICETSRQPHSADDPSPPMDVARNALRTAIARAISDATAAAVDEFIDGHAKRLCEQAGYKWSRDDEDSDGEADDWALEIHDVLNHLRADKDLTIHDGRSSARGTVGGLCGECGGEGVILGGDDGHGNQEEWPCRSCTRGPLPKGGCTHAVTHRGANIPRRYGSWQSEVCDACGSFRARDHHGNLADMGRWREWRPASEYAAAIDDTDEGATRGPLPKGG